MKKVTKNYLQKLGACQDGLEWWANNCEGLILDKQLLKLDKHKADWANWLMVRLLNRKDKVRYAVFAAELVLNIFEKKYPNDDRPRKAIESAKIVINPVVPVISIAWYTSVVPIDVALTSGFSSI